jgi:hypothetical protein
MGGKSKQFIRRDGNGFLKLYRCSSSVNVQRNDHNIL